MMNTHNKYPYNFKFVKETKLIKGATSINIDSHFYNDRDLRVKYAYKKLVFIK